MAQLVKTLQCGRPGFDPQVGKILWRRERLPTPVFWPGESHGVAKSRTQLSDCHFTYFTHKCSQQSGRALLHTATQGPRPGESLLHTVTQGARVKETLHFLHVASKVTLVSTSSGQMLRRRKHAVHTGGFYESWKWPFSLPH